MGLKKGIQGATVTPPAPEVTTKVPDPEPVKVEAAPEPKAPEPAPEVKAKPAKAAPAIKTYVTKAGSLRDPTTGITYNANRPMPVGDKGGWLRCQLAAGVIVEYAPRTPE